MPFPAIHSGGGGHFLDFRLKPAALTSLGGSGLNPLLQTTWEYSVMGGGLRLVFMKQYDGTGCFTAKGMGDTVLLPGRFPLLNPSATTPPSLAGFATTLSPDWIRVTIRYDAATAASDVFLNGTLAAAGIPAATDALPGTETTWLRVRGHTFHPTYFDDVQVTTLNPCFNDADRDGMSDDYEVAHGQSPVADDRSADPDNDGLSNITESIYGSDPLKADTDSDGMGDPWEIQYRLNPLRAKDAHYDLDGDGATNLEEYTASTDPWSNPDANSASPSMVYVRADAAGQMDGSQVFPFDNIQTALTVVADGGTLVLDGSGGPFTGYGNRGIYLDKFLRFHGVNHAIIDCENQESGFFLYAYSYTYGFPPQEYGSSPCLPALAGHTFRDLTFRNSAGSAIACHTGTPLNIIRCSFEGTANSPAVVILDSMAGFLLTQWYTQGFYYGTEWSATAWLEDCLFRNNTAGAISVDSGLSYTNATGALNFSFRPSLWLEVVQTRFENNSGAPATRVTAVGSQFINCLWKDNTSNGTGGALLLGSPALPTLTHCTFLGNDTGPVGAVQILPWDLADPYYSGFPWSGPISPLAIRSSILWGNTPSDVFDPTFSADAAYSTIQNSFPGVVNYVSTLDPLFLPGTAWPSAASPAIDAADPGSPFSTDIVHQTRRDKSGTGTPGTTADQGAYEFSPDSDADGLADLLEEQHGLDPANSTDGAADFDQDGFANSTEIAAGSNHNDAASIPASAAGTIVLVDPLNGNESGNGFPSPVKTISRALTLATATTPAKTIILRDGTYTGTANRDWNFAGKAVTLRSVNGPTRTIIDLAGAGRAARIPASHPGGLSITGLAFRNGSAPADSTSDGTVTNAEGGAFFIAGSTSSSAALVNKATFAGCWFIGCKANGTPTGTAAVDDGSGGALRLSGKSAVTATNCQFLANSAIRYGGAVYAGTNGKFAASNCRFEYNEANGSGGAIYGNSATVIADGCSLSWNIAGAIGHVSGDTLTGDGGAVYLENPAATSCLLHCRIEGNAAFEGGGGIYLHGTSSTPASGTILVDRCEVFSNLTADFTFLPTANLQEDAGRYGAGIAVDGFAPAINACVIRYNECGDDGGGVSVHASTPTLRATAIVDNWALHHGGGLLSRDGATPYIQRCTIVFNAANSGSGGGIRVEESTSHLYLADSIVWNNIAASLTSPSFSPGTWNLNAPPAGSALLRNRIQSPADLGPYPSTNAPRFLADGYHLAPDSPDKDTGPPAQPGPNTASPPDIDGEYPVGPTDRGCDEFVDLDNDLLADAFEWQIIHASESDSYTTLADVKPADDFDHDGINNSRDQARGIMQSAINVPLKLTPVPWAPFQVPWPIDPLPGDPWQLPNRLVLGLILDDDSDTNGELWKITFTPIAGNGTENTWAMPKPGTANAGLAFFETSLANPAAYALNLGHGGGIEDYDYVFKMFLISQPPQGPAYILLNRNGALPTPQYVGLNDLSGLIGAKNTPNDATEAEKTASLNELLRRRAFLCPVSLKSVSFSGEQYVELRTDRRHPSSPTDENSAAAVYAAPHWLDQDMDGSSATEFWPLGSLKPDGERNFPVSFAADSTPKLAATINLPGAAGINFKISATCTSSGVPMYFEWIKTAENGVLTLEAKPATVAAGSNSPAKFPARIGFYDAMESMGLPFKIQWRITPLVAGVDTGTTLFATSKHTVYVTLRPPVNIPDALKRETLFHLGCFFPGGMEGGDAVKEQAIVDAIYAYFKGKNVQRVVPSTAELDGTGMIYWKQGVPAPCLNTLGLLHEGDGACGAWSYFFRDMLRAQGINCKQVEFRPPVHPPEEQLNAPESEPFPAGSLGASYDAAAKANWPTYTGRVTGIRRVFLIRNWTIGALPFTYEEIDGVAGQSNDDPHSHFSNHAVVKYSYGGSTTDVKYYDPSYGTGPFSSPQEWEAASVSAFGYFLLTNDLGPTYPEPFFYLTKDNTDDTALDIDFDP